MKIYALVDQVMDGKGVTHDEFKGLTTEENVVKAWLQMERHVYYMTDDLGSFVGLCEFFDSGDMCDGI